jgi:hypothetical protein
MHLTSEDWEAIDAAFLGHTDPMLGAEAAAKYEALFRRIVNLAPPPLGVAQREPIANSRIPGMIKPSTLTTIISVPSTGKISRCHKGCLSRLAVSIDALKRYDPSHKLVPNAQSGFAPDHGSSQLSR